MDAAIRVAARAKINLNLHVVAARDDGYHDLDTLVTFAEFGDVVTARPNPNGPQFGIALEGPFADALMEAAPLAADNIVVKAAAGLRSLAERAGLDCAPVHLTVEKNLPVAAGLGGGSADAAATVAALSRLWSLPPKLPGLEMLPQLLGADVAMCLAGRPLRATGVGDRLEPVSMGSLHVVLVNLGIGLSTPSVFHHDALGRSGSQGTVPPDLLTHLRETANDLEPAAMALVPEVADVIAALRTTEGCELARMSGSGATCFGIYADAGAAERSRALVAAMEPDWWCITTRTVAA